MPAPVRRIEKEPFMKKLFAALAAVAAFSAQAADELNVAATAVPHAEILEFVKPQLAE